MHTHSHLFPLYIHKKEEEEKEGGRRDEWEEEKKRRRKRRELTQVIKAHSVTFIRQLLGGN